MRPSPEDPTFEALIRQHRLPASYRETVADVIEPLANWLAGRVRNREAPLVVGLQGAQGTGKSTLTDFLQQILDTTHGLSSAAFSLDDLYHTRATRRSLAAEVHPLLQTRGVPGTHDLALGQITLNALLYATSNSKTPLPRFDKASDDRVFEADWPVFHGRPDVILIEGWCVGARPQAEAALREPVNALEAEEDPQAVWRTWVNDQLAGAYQDFFDRLDCLIMLKAPGMDCVLEWRLLQEHRLAEAVRRAPESGRVHCEAAPERRIMTDGEVRRFVMHYERITRHCLTEMPHRADRVLDVDAQHRIAGFSPPDESLP